MLQVLLAPAIHAWVAVRMGMVYVGHAANETSEGTSSSLCFTLVSYGELIFMNPSLQAWRREL
jgi:hypothetical protein